MIQLPILAVGVVLLTVGVALLSVPAAFIVCGAALSVFALLWDWPEKGGDV